MIISGKAKEYNGLLLLAYFWIEAKGKGHDWYWKQNWGGYKNNKVSKDNSTAHPSNEKCLKLYTKPNQQDSIVLWLDRLCSDEEGEGIPICEAFLPQDC